MTATTRIDDNFIGAPSRESNGRSEFLQVQQIKSDSGLTRNTRAPGYRCSVPGLAGFTGTTLCGARSLITCQGISNFRLPIADWRCRYSNSNQLRKRERDDFGLISS